MLCLCRHQVQGHGATQKQQARYYDSYIIVSSLGSLRGNEASDKKIAGNKDLGDITFKYAALHAGNVIGT